MLKKLLNLLLEKFFKFVSKKDVLNLKRGTFYHDGREIPQDEALNIINFCKRAKAKKGFDLLIEKIEAAACEKIYRDATNWKQLISAKAMLWATDMLREIINEYAEISLKDGKFRK